MVHRIAKWPMRSIKMASVFVEPMERRVGTRNPPKYVMLTRTVAEVVKLAKCPLNVQQLPMKPATVALAQTLHFASKVICANHYHKFRI